MKLNWWKKIDLSSDWEIMIMTQKFQNMSNPNDGQNQAPPPLSGYDEMRRINRETSGQVDCEIF